MPIDLDKVSQIKERILSIIKLKGPTLPIHIAKALNISPLFTSAFLSEMFSERKLFMSHMKIGSSSLYLIPGQENMLENFIDSLNVREKEAVLLLKAKRLLEDSLLAPVIRVALRSATDFAIPIKINVDGQQKIFWKYFLVQDSDIKNIIQETMIQTPISPKVQQQLPEIPQVTETAIGNIIEKTRIIPEKLEEKTHPEINETSRSAPDNIKKEKPKKKDKSSEFAEKIKEYLASKEIEILEVIEEKKKEFYAKVRTDESFGKQEYYLMAKDKKKILEIDLIIALQKAQENKMQSLIIAPGEIDKKALEYYKSWKNMIKFHKIKL